MTPDEKKLLITTHLARRLKEVGHGSVYRDINDIADKIMNGWVSDAGDDMMKTYTPLWEIIAPLVDGIGIYRDIDHLLEGRGGEPLTKEVREAMMLDIARIITAHSTTVEIKGRISRSTSTARVWGGALPGTPEWKQLTREDHPDDKQIYKDGAGV
jgi:hypothetical protein